MTYKLIAVEAVTKEEGLFLHVASTLEKAIEWIKKHGKDWYDEEYCFIAYSVEVDNDDFCEDINDLVYITKDGIIVGGDNPLFK